MYSLPVRHGLRRSFGPDMLPVLVKPKKPTIIGIYGVPGSGKTTLLAALKKEVDNDTFTFYEGSEVIASVCPGGLEAFNSLSDEEKTHWRAAAVADIRQKCLDDGTTAVVAGHFMFWPEHELSGTTVCTQADLDTYTHILYVEIPADTIAEHRAKDEKRRRTKATATHLERWKKAEKDQLRPLCRENGILFMALAPHLIAQQKVSAIIKDFQTHTEAHNMALAEKRLDEIMSKNSVEIGTVLLLDSDKTLAPQDSGLLFWEKAIVSKRYADETSPLKEIFGSSLEYSYTAFRQATLLHEEVLDDQEFESLCQDVAASLVMYPEFVSLLHMVAQNSRTKAIVVTCGLRRIWEIVLKNEGLSHAMEVIGGGRLSDEFVVTAAVKGALVTRLHKTSTARVWAFGDSPLDLEMLKRADESVIVTGEEQTRSKSMDKSLSDALAWGVLRARQVVLPSHVRPRLNTARLPLVQLSDPRIIDAIFPQHLQVFHATERPAAKLIMTPMRDSSLAGPALREAHRRAGWYLATEFLTQIIGVDKTPIQHVQGHTTDGYQLLQEKETLILALMRGGEPMALGVNDAFPRASLLHAKDPIDVKDAHLQGRRTVLLVDSVVNRGKKVFGFIQSIRRIHPSIPICVVAGVIYEPTISAKNMAHHLGTCPELSFVTLRLSNNQFTGIGTTDTGNRLFNTVYLS